MMFRSLLLLALALNFPVSRAEETPATPPATPAEPAAPTPEPLPAMDPANLEALRPKVGETVALEGTVVKIGVSKSGDVFYVNFSDNYRKAASLVLFDRSAGKESTKAALDALVGAKVRAQGKLEEYKGNLQVKVTKAADITKVAAE
jgi:RecJ-like exonuclease